MAHTALLIHNNPAVHATVALALKELGVNVKAVTDGKNAEKAINKLKPQLILCSSSLEDLDPFALYQYLVEAKRKVAFILLTPMDDVFNIVEEAEEVGIEEILSEPFKPDQLSRVVERVLSDAGFDEVLEEEQEQNPVLLVLKDEFLQRVLTLLFENSGIPFKLCENQAKARSSVKKNAFCATLVDWNAVSDIEWFDVEKMGKLIVVLPENESSELLGGTENVKTLKRPLSVHAIAKVLAGCVSFRSTAEEESLVLESQAQTALAARISASIFERLLQGEALRDCDWPGAARLAEQELLRICDEFEARHLVK